MAKYTAYSNKQGRDVPSCPKGRFPAGAFEYMLSHPIDNGRNISFLCSRFNNDKTGSPAEHLNYRHHCRNNYSHEIKK